MNQPEVYVCLFFLEPPSMAPPHLTAVSCHRALGWAPCVIQQLCTSYLFYLWECICFSATLSVRPSPPSPAMSTCLSSVSTWDRYSYTVTKTVNWSKCPQNKFDKIYQMFINFQICLFIILLWEKYPEEKVSM